MDKSNGIVYGVVLFLAIFFAGFAFGVVLLGNFTESFNEANACYGKATGSFKEGGHLYYFRVVIDTAKTDSANNWRRK